MPAKVKVVVTGIRSIDKRLRTLPLKVQKKVANQAIRAGMKLVATAVRQLAPVLTGVLKANVVVRAGLKRKRGQVSIDARIDANDQTKKTSKKTGETVFYPAIVEYGRKKQGVPGDHYMLHAFHMVADAARNLTIRMLREGIEREARK